MLSYYEFSQLSKEKQQELVMNSAEPIGSTKKNDIDFELCKLFDFYVEIVYNAERTKVVSLTSYLKSTH
ncbi:MULTISPECIES: hypothetical protein [Chryseobacterium]|uniref:hypothetical protein n=1 Tax=Chryseobacterium TaxID=59732 RepID=UPI001629C17C|nr:MULTISPECIES: hypothetical protein [Chryseobacterium]MBF6643888.1 hypothetical protein [Chryseobacterium indologenes]MBU3047153.1 hypothetical protein [Chryseobacterium indologenes]QQQ72385.1 hypothetical protein JHW31_06575 [Chryseobacterium indologenes]WET50779.1 hypothetical protein PYS58_06510 [Chryseobacterium indologenes]